jgi:hypothetical protein
MRIRQRIAKLEQRSRGDDDPRLLVFFDDGGGTMTAEGETMTEAGWRARCQPRDSDIVVKFFKRATSWP